MVRQVGGDALEQRDGGPVVAQHDEAHVAVALQQQPLGQQPHAHDALERARRARARALRARRAALALAHERESDDTKSNLSI